MLHLNEKKKDKNTIFYDKQQNNVKKVNLNIK